jgi:uncharacterized membrane protein
MSFLRLGILRVGQQTQPNHLEQSERSLYWMHLLFLFAVSLTCFPRRCSLFSSPTARRC